MNCCIDCFSDQGLRNRIESLATTKGNCDFCGTKNIIITKCESLSDNFENLFELYVNHPNSLSSLRIDKPFLLHEHLQVYWGKLFNTKLLAEKDIKQLVNQIGRGSQLYSESLFEEPVEFILLVDSYNSSAEDLELKWDIFADEIKFKNRFFLSEMIDTDSLRSVFELLSFTYPAQTVFYRARVSETKLPLDKLGKPPYELTTPGRANPIGIPYLYVSDSEKTTLFETRISLHEHISIGKFVSKVPISLVSLKNVAEYGPFEIIDRGFTLEQFIQYRPYLQKLENELSKPVRKQDVHLDYLPTQFLCEFIKSVGGFDAVEYKSAMNPEGYNLAIFNDDKLECVDVEFYHVTSLDYSFVKIK